MSKEVRMAKKASKLLYKLYLSGIKNISIDVGDEDVKLEVFIQPVNSVIAKKRVDS